MQKNMIILEGGALGGGGYQRFTGRGGGVFIFKIIFFGQQRDIRQFQFGSLVVI